ncbi:D-alanyl-D-alanine carboxypeptidase [Streptomyces sp. NPDC005004]
MEEASVAGESPDRSKQGNSVGSAEGVDSAESEERSAGAGAKGGANSVARDGESAEKAAAATTSEGLASGGSGSGGDNVSADFADAAESGSASRADDASEPSVAGSPEGGHDAAGTGESDDKEPSGAAKRNGSPSGVADAPKSPAADASRAAKDSPGAGDGSASDAAGVAEKGDKPGGTPDAESGSAEDTSAAAAESGSGDKTPGATSAPESDAGSGDAGQKPGDGTGPAEKSTPGSAGRKGTGESAPSTKLDAESAPEGKSASDDKGAPGSEASSADTSDRESAAASGQGRADKSDDTSSTKPGSAAKPAGKSDDTSSTKPGSAAKPAGKSAGKSAPADRAEGDAAPADKADDESGSADSADRKATPASEQGPADETEDTSAPSDKGDGKSGSTSKAGPADKADDKSGAKPGSADKPGGKSAPADKPGGKLIPAPTSAPADKATPTDQPTTTLRSPKQPQPPKDQPTTTLRAPKGVDQPTTMLKVGGKEKGDEKEAEKTSRFVALKGDIRTAPAEETRTVPQVGPERTTQQPLPPKPPLDLLAELTNTPPPPETPVRTLVRRVKIWTPLVLLLVVILGVAQALRPLPAPTLDLTAKDSYTFEGGKVDVPWPTEGQAALDVQGVGTFGSSGSDKPVPTASVAKVMTAYLILHDHPLKSGAAGPKIEIDKTAESQSKAGQESTVDVTAGDRITQREALQDILLASANNIARLLARWDAGSVDAFVAKMNTTAKRLGMSNTKYTDPSGLTDSTVSTARDQVKLAKAAMTYPAFREVAAMMSYTDYKGTYHSNWNQLVGHNNVVGIKTGTTTSALGNLVFAAKRDVDGETRMIIGAVMRQPAGGPENTILSAALDHSDKLIRAAQGALRSATVLKKGTVVGYVDDGLGGRTPVEVTEDVKATGWAGLKVKLSFTGGPVPHTAKAGTKVGSLTVGDGSTGAVKVPVALRDDLAEPGLGSKLTRLG